MTIPVKIGLGVLFSFVAYVVLLFVLSLLGGLGTLELILLMAVAVVIGAVAVLTLDRRRSSRV